VTYLNSGVLGCHEDCFFIGWDYNHFGDYNILNKSGKITSMEEVKRQLDYALRILDFLYESRLRNTMCRKHLFDCVKDDFDELHHVVDCARENNLKLTDSCLADCPYQLEKTVIEQ
jgi:hypothetical protein